jgi:hypothetical protein
MITNSSKTGSSGLKPYWGEVIKFLFIVAFVVILYLLGQSMVQHHFFRGGGLDRHSTTQP